MKIDGKEVFGAKSHSGDGWDKKYIDKNGSLMSGVPMWLSRDWIGFHMPDVKIKNLKYTNLLKNPVFTGSKYIPHVWSEKKN